MLDRRLIWAAVLAAAVSCAPGFAQVDEQELKQDAIGRLIDSHDPALSVGIGRVYVKQAALLAARELLRERGRAAGLAPEQWNARTEPWRRSWRCSSPACWRGRGSRDRWSPAGASAPYSP